MNKNEKLDDEYFEDEHFRRRKYAYHDTRPNYESLKGYLVAFFVGVVVGTAAWLYANSMKEEKKKDCVYASEISLPEKEPFKYFSIEAMVDGVGYDISRPLPANIVPRAYHVVVRNKTLDGEHVELRRPIEVDAVEGLLDCVNRSLKMDRKSSYRPSEYASLVEKLPGMDAVGDYRTITKFDVTKAHDRARGGLRAIIGE